MKAATYSKTGNKATTQITLDKTVFEVVPSSNVLIAQAYESNRKNQRTSNALTKTRGLVRGGGKKPWKQKGTGRARAGSIRSPIWRGGGITFGPTGELSRSKMPQKSKRTALKQALSLAAKAGTVIVIESFDYKDGKVKPTSQLLGKLDVNGRALLIVEDTNELINRATRNITNLTVTSVARLNLNDVLDHDKTIFTKKSLEMLSQRLESK